MVSWGLAASAMILVHTALSFYLLRFLLGVAEAGFFPGIIFYLTYWYPARDRAKAYAWFLAAIPISGVLGGPISGALLGLDGVLGMQGWQWLFLLEGIPSVIVGVLVFCALAGSAARRALAASDRARLARSHARDRASAADCWTRRPTFGRHWANPVVWLLGAMYFLLIVSLYGFALWLPQLIKATGEFSNFEVGMITAIPYTVAAIGMVLVGRRSDRTGERYLYLALPAIAGAAGFIMVTRIGTTGLLVAALTLTAFGVLGWLGPFWALPTAFLKEQAAAGGIALINSVGAMGGFVGPYLLAR